MRIEVAEPELGKIKCSHNKSSMCLKISFVTFWLHNILLHHCDTSTIESSSATLTPTNSISSDGYINISIDTSGGANYIDSVNNEWECVHTTTSKIDACLIVDVNPPGGELIQEFNLSLYLTKVTAEIDPLVVFYNPINKTYFSYIWGWDGYFSSSIIADVFAAPVCGSTSLYTVSNNIYERISGYPTNGRTAFGDGNSDNWDALSTTTISYSNPSILSLKNDVRNNTLETSFWSIETGIVTCTYHVSFGDLTQLTVLVLSTDTDEDVTINNVVINVTWSATNNPTYNPSSNPTGLPSNQPSALPSAEPTGHPTEKSSNEPSGQPSIQPSDEPSSPPSGQPSGNPSSNPSLGPTTMPSGIPTGCYFDSNDNFFIAF